MNSDDLMELGRACMAPLNPPHHNGTRIVTAFDCKPIPLRDWDWSAVLDGYDGSEDSNDPIGWGATEAEAIADLRDQLADRED